MGTAVVAIVAAAAGGFTEAAPAGGAVAGAEEAVGGDEGFKEDGRVAVSGTRRLRQVKTIKERLSGSPIPITR